MVFTGERPWRGERAESSLEREQRRKEGEGRAEREREGRREEGREVVCWKDEDHHTLLIYSWGQVMEHDGELIYKLSCVLSAACVILHPSCLRHRNRGHVRDLFLLLFTFHVCPLSGHMTGCKFSSFPLIINQPGHSFNLRDKSGGNLLKGRCLEVNPESLLVFDHCSQ